MSHDLRYVVVDVFTDKPLAGNQLAVFTGGRGASDAEMQALAREMNFSETVFVLPPEATATHACASSRRRSSFRSPGIRFSAPRSCSPSRCS